MKSLRVWLLILLTVLLPLRGALAAAMMCPPASVGAQHVLELAGEPQSLAQGHSHQGGESTAHEHVDNSGGIHNHASAGEPDRCNVCSAFCSLTGVINSQGPIAVPQKVSTVFPQLSASPPNFFADGQERPPRTI